MTWTFHQSTGEIDHDGKIVGRGFSGRGSWRNSPNAQRVQGKGPLPRGEYRLPYRLEDDPKLGKHVLHLTPRMGTRLYGREEFAIHGNLPDAPVNQSNGGIVTSFRVRMEMLHSDDRILEVVA